MDEFPGNPPNPPLSKGGEGGFLKFLANLGANSSLRDYGNVSGFKFDGFIRSRHSGENRRPDIFCSWKQWIPASAGMTEPAFSDYLQKILF
jgi:hypothetical protein